MENISHLSGDNAQDVAYTYKIFNVFNKNTIHENIMFYFNDKKIFYSSYENNI